MNKRRLCPQCGSGSHFRFEVGDLNRRLTSQRFRYDECDRCRLVFQRDTPADLAPYYASDY